VWVATLFCSHERMNTGPGEVRGRHIALRTTIYHNRTKTKTKIQTT